MRRRFRDLAPLRALLVGALLLCANPQAAAQEATDVPPPVGAPDESAPPQPEWVEGAGWMDWSLTLSAEGGYGFNPLRMSDFEQRVAGTAAGGSLLSGSFPAWPTDRPDLPLIRPGLHGRIAFSSASGAVTSFELSYRPLLPPTAIDTMSHPVALTFGQSALSMGSGEARLRFEVTGRINPYEYDRPLRIRDAALHNPLPDRFEQAVRLSYGGRASVRIGLAPGYKLAPFYDLTRLDYGDDLANWDALVHRVGGELLLRPGRHMFLLDLRGAFVSKVADGNRPGTDLRESDSSWAGAAGGLSFVVDTELLGRKPWIRGELYGDYTWKQFRTGDRTDLSHFGREDHGVAAGARFFIGARDGKVRGLGLSLTYELGWNTTNLPANVIPEDTNDFLDNRVLLGIHYRISPKARMLAAQ